MVQITDVISGSRSVSFLEWPPCLCICFSLSIPTTASPLNYKGNTRAPLSHSAQSGIWQGFSFQRSSLCLKESSLLACLPLPIWTGCILCSKATSFEVVLPFFWMSHVGIQIPWNPTSSSLVHTCPGQHMGSSNLRRSSVGYQKLINT